MATLDAFITKERQQVCKEFNVNELYLLGPAVSGNFSKESGLDFNVDFGRQR